MNCPSCGAAMTALTLDGHLGRQVNLDLCSACQVIWFDHLENLRLSPGATLQLFRVIGDRNGAARPPLREPLTCPRCDIRLILTNDRQRNTPFRYWRCAREHGRLTTFFDFLREKDFIRPLSPQQLAELRQNVQMINCSNCGAPIDLMDASACAHCGTPVSMIDVKQIGRMTDQLARADSVARRPPDAAARRPPDVDDMFEAIRIQHQKTGGPGAGLVEAGLELIARWLT